MQTGTSKPLSLAINTQQVLASEAAGELWQRRLFELSLVAPTVCITVSGYRDIGDFRAICELIEAACAKNSAVDICIRDPSMGVASLLEARRDLLGPGQLFLLASAARLRKLHFQTCWAHRKDALVLVPELDLLPRSSLLDREAGTTIAGYAGLVSPAETAWVNIRFSLSPYVSGACIDYASLEAALADSVEEGDKLHSSSRWPTARTTVDSWENRRLAIELTDIAEVSERIGCLASLMRLLNRIESHLELCSRLLAMKKGAIPALALQNPGQSIVDDELRTRWTTQWRAAIRRNALRHRNLLAISPWSLLPGSADGAQLTDSLFSLLASADTLAMGGCRYPDQWDWRDFRGFHNRLASALQQRCARNQIAKLV